jgi:hypothetical protein
MVSYMHVVLGISCCQVLPFTPFTDNYHLLSVIISDKTSSLKETIPAGEVARVKDQDNGISICHFSILQE